MWYGWELVIVSHHLAKFSDHTHCGREDVISLVCYLILQNHKTKGSLLEDRDRGSEDLMLLVCHEISQALIIKGSCDFMDYSS